MSVCGLVADGELVVPGGDGAVALESADAALDGVALLGRVQTWAAGAAPRSLVIRQMTSTVFPPFVVAVRRNCPTCVGTPVNSIHAGTSAIS